MCCGVLIVESYWHWFRILPTTCWRCESVKCPTSRNLCAWFAWLAALHWQCTLLPAWLIHHSDQNCTGLCSNAVLCPQLGFTNPWFWATSVTYDFLHRCEQLWGKDNWTVFENCSEHHLQQLDIKRTQRTHHSELDLQGYKCEPPIDNGEGQDSLIGNYSQPVTELVCTMRQILLGLRIGSDSSLPYLKLLHSLFWWWWWFGDIQTEGESWHRSKTLARLSLTAEKEGRPGPDLSSNKSDFHSF